MEPTSEASDDMPMFSLEEKRFTFKATETPFLAKQNSYSQDSTGKVASKDSRDDAYAKNDSYEQKNNKKGKPSSFGQ